MFVQMLQTVANATESYLAGERYELSDAEGAHWVRSGVARRTTQPPEIIEQLLQRLDIGAGKRALYLPFCGEFGHLIMSHLRIVHFSRAKEKIVCCRPGQQVLFPSATEYMTDWTDPTPEDRRIATMRDRPILWPDLEARFPDAVPVEAGRLTPTQELHAIEPNTRIPFRPRRRGLAPDVVLGVRHRALFNERNWPRAHWDALADALTANGYTFAVMGDKATSLDLAGQEYHTGDMDTDAAVESLQSCRLYIGTDSGGSHLASTIGANMLVFRTSAGHSRNLFDRMEIVNPGRITRLPESVWNRPADIAAAALNMLRCVQANFDIS